MASTKLQLFFKQLTALLWKCLIVRRFYYFQCAMETLGPLVITIAYLVIYSSVSPSQHEGPKNSTLGPVIYDDFNWNITWNPYLDFFLFQEYQIFYTPNNSYAESLLGSLNQKPVSLRPFETESQLNTEMARLIEADSLGYSQLLGIYFNQSTVGELSYKLKLPGSDSVLTITKGKFPVKPNQQDPNTDPSAFYVYQRFSTVQAYINRAHLKSLCSKTDPNCSTNLDKPLTFDRMPYPKYRNIQISVIQNLLSFILPIGCIIVCPLIVLRITEEKSLKTRELLRMIGMSDLMFWVAHFLDHFLVFTAHALCFTVILFAFKIFTLSSWVLFLLFYILFAAQLTLFLLFLTSILHKPQLAINLAYIILSLLLTGSILLIPTMSPNINVANTNIFRQILCFFPPASLIWYLSVMGSWESEGMGLDFSTVGTGSSLYGNFTAGNVLLNTFLSLIIYSFLIFYIDNVSPFQQGVPKKAHFLYTKDYWCPAKADEEDDPIPESDNPYQDDRIYECEPHGLNPTIRIKKLSKMFDGKKAKKPAVDDLWLNIYENQITVLLGHNGAGKTTTMNMITGMFPSSSGSIYVNGHNVFTQTRLARQSLGLCSQENIQFKELTTGQHLRLFALLKDYPTEQIDKEVDDILTLLKLTDKKNVLSTKLSGGMKRKLSLGIALVGGTKTLILDEPTSGMDPDTRRVIWDLLITIRRQRTILLTTHYMEEADVLGDRIAIMNEGKLSCVGSPLFLKKTFGTGYRLRIAKQDNSQFSSSKFQQTLRSYIPSVSLSSEIETEVLYSLEADSATKDKAEKTKLMETLTRLFEDIETNKDKYGVDSFGLSYSTLEDVFLAVGSDLELKTQNLDDQKLLTLEMDHDYRLSGAEQDLLLSKQSDLITGTELWFNQIVGLFAKRFNYARRYWKTIFLQLIIPFSVMILALVISKVINASGKSTDTNVVLNLDVKNIYGPSTQTFFYGSKTYEPSYQKVNTELYQANVSFVPDDQTSDYLINEWILNKIDDNIPEYVSKYLYGVGDVGSHYKIWFNFEQYHSLPLSVNVFYESLLESITGNISQTKIKVKSAPVVTPRSAQSQGISMLILSWAIICLSIMPNAFLYLGASFILQPIRENASKAKLLQLMTGLSPATFWAVNLAFDLLTHLSIISLMLIMAAILDFDKIFFRTAGTGTALFGLFFSFGLGIIPFAYVLSYGFQKTSRGFAVMMQVSSYLGTIAGGLFSAGDLLLNYFGFASHALQIVFTVFLSIFRILPIFSVVFGFQKLYKLSNFARFCDSLKKEKQLDLICASIAQNETNIFKGCCEDICGDSCYYSSPWGFTKFGVGPEVLYMTVTGMVCFGFIVAFELRKQQFSKFFSRFNIRKLFKSSKKSTNSSTKQTSSALITEDSDVLKEKSRIEHESTKSDLLTVCQLTRQFDQLTAVDGLTFGVHHEECFGLLGVNGAGKTTTFSMLTGDLLPSSGDAYIHKGSYALIAQMREFQQAIGYCPQFDALLTKLTGEEMLYLFARLRGIPKNHMERDVRNLIRMTGLEAHAQKRIDSYSGGTKRKLSIAIALVGSPPLLFLDEPTSGVDPVARRKIWQTLGYLKRNFNSSIVLTSHSMEECEALCSRIGIMVNGKFCCLGSPQHLRSKYGQGYSVTISLRKLHESNQEYVDSVQRELQSLIPSALLKDYHQSLLLYHITDQSERWSNIFAQMSKLNEQFDFEDYYVSDTTLEQIFIMFARHQVKSDEDGGEIDKKNN